MNQVCFFQHVWFERSELRDRKAVGRRLMEHTKDTRNYPCLIFPEGTCINNTSVMQFKKGSFEASDTIYPGNFFEFFKGSSHTRHFIFEINVGKGRIRHTTTLILNLQSILSRSRNSISDSLYVGSDSFRH